MAVLLAWVLGALVVGVAAGLTLLDPLADGDTSTGVGPVRRDPPAVAASANPTDLAVQLGPVDPAVPLTLGDGEEIDIAVVVTNPTAQPASGIEVEVEPRGATCQWPTGPFPVPFGLAPAASTQRTCRLALTRQGPGSLRVIAHHRASGTEAVLDVPWHPPTVDELAAAPGGAPPEARATTPPTCPRLVDGLELAASPLLEDLGGGMTDRARLLDLRTCPSWTAVSGLSATRQHSGDACLAWLISLAPSAVPVGRVTPVPGSAGCASAPATVEVFGQPAEVGAMVATLAAWTVDGDTTRAAGSSRAASGSSEGCEAGGIVAVRNAHQIATPSGPTYRATVAPC